MFSRGEVVTGFRDRFRRSGTSLARWYAAVATHTQAMYRSSVQNKRARMSRNKPRTAL